MSRHMSITGIALIALALTACGAPIFGRPTPTPSPSSEPSQTAGPTLTSLPMITPADMPVPRPTQQEPGFPELCDITHSYWLKPGNTDQGIIPSPDGKYVEYQQGVGFALEETATGKTQTLSGGGEGPGTWSPHSDQLALIEATGFPPSTSTYNLIVVDLSQGIDSSRRIGVLVGSVFSPYIVGWSPDGAYLAFVASPVSSASAAVMVWSVRDERIVYENQSPDVAGVVRSAWSPDSRRLALLSHGPAGFLNNPPRYQLTTVDMASGGQVTQPVSGPVGDVNDLDVYGASMLWSPDSLNVALILVKRIALYRPEADKPVQVVSFTNMMVRGPFAREGYVAAAHFPVVSWQGDNRALLVWNHSDSTAYELDRMSVDPPKVEPVVTVDQLPIFEPPDLGYFFGPPSTVPSNLAGLAFFSGVKPHVQLNLIDTNNGAIVPMITDAADVGTPVWSPDYGHLAVVWTRADQSAGLAWANSRGDDRHDLEGKSYTHIHDVSWSPDNQVLTLVGTDGVTSSVETVDTGTGARHVLLDGLITAVDPLYNDSGAFLTVRWVMPSGESGYDGFDRQWNRLFRVRINGDVTVSSQLFFSPDRKMAAVKVGSPGDARHPGAEMLVVARPDGSAPVTLKAGLTGLGDPLWSPDSHLLAFTQATDGRWVTWQLVNTHGRVLWTGPATPPGSYNYSMYGNLVWAPCPR